MTINAHAAPFLTSAPYTTHTVLNRDKGYSKGAEKLALGYSCPAASALLCRSTSAEQHYPRPAPGLPQSLIAYLCRQAAAMGRN